MSKGPFTVFDGLEDVWPEFEKTLRREGERRFRETANDVKSGLEGMTRRVVQSRPVAVVDALVGNRTTTRPQDGPVDYREVDRRMQVTRNERDQMGRMAEFAGPPGGKLAGTPLAAALWFDRVRPHGAWDDKAHKEGGASVWERQGNFSFGATASALGLSEETALRGAGLAQRIGAVQDVLTGKSARERSGWLSPPYGDDPRDQPPIREGYAYGRSRASARRR